MPRLQRKLAGSNEPAATGNNKLFPNLRKRPAAPLTEAEPYNGSLGEAPRTPLPLDTKPAPRRLLNPKKYGSVELFPAPKAEERPAGPPSVRRSVLAW